MYKKYKFNSDVCSKSVIRHRSLWWANRFRNKHSGNRLLIGSWSFHRYQLLWFPTSLLDRSSVCVCNGCICVL